MADSKIIPSAFGDQLFLRIWPVDQPKGVLIISHGHGEHIDRYAPFAEFFGKQGFVVLGADWPGHGQTDGKRGHAQNLDQLLSILDQVLAFAVENYPQVPKVLFGQSMGGNLALNYLLRKQTNLDGVVVNAPWIRLAFAPNPVMVFLGKVVGRIIPKFVQPSGLNPDHISRDPEEVKKYTSDPLVHDRISAGLGLTLLDSAAWLDNYSGSTTCPVLVMHGTGDQITSQPASAEFADRLSGPVTYKAWKGMYHETHNEQGRENVLAYIGDWISKNVLTR
jgi:acylglycerol lipase